MLNLKNSIAIAGSSLALWLVPASVLAEPTYPEVVNLWCTQQQRIPPQPIPVGFPASCDACHMPGQYNGGSKVQPAFDEMKAAVRARDYSYFCPLLANANTPPVLALIGAKTVSEGQLLAFRITSTDADGDALTTSASDLPTGSSFTDNRDGTGDFTWTPDYGQAGNYAVTFMAVDASAEMASASEQITISVGDVNRPPTLAQIGNHSVNEGEPLAFTVTALDPDQDLLVLSAADLPTGATFTDSGTGSGDFRWTPGFDRAGNYPVTIMVTDRGNPAAADSETFTVTVGNVNRPPVLATIGNRAADPDVALTIPMTAADPDGDALTFSAAGLPAGAQFNDLGNGMAEFSWTPAANQVGNHSVTFSVNDAGNPAEADSESVTITVGQVNRPPVLGAIGNRMVSAGDLLSFVVTAFDPDGDALVFTADVPLGASFADLGNGTAEFSWVPNPEQAGNHVATFTVTDKGAPAAQHSEQIMITVGRVNRPPTLAAIGDRAVVAGESLTVMMTASDPDGDPLRCDVAGLPAGAQFKDNGNGTAELSWLPSADQLGRHSLTVMVYDSGVPMEADAETFAITVTPAADNTPPQAELSLRRARWKGGRLVVDGRSTPGAMVDIVDAEAGTLFGTATTNDDGKFKLRVRPSVVPCAVEARIGAFASGAVLVEDAPDTCGHDGALYLRIKDVEWNCDKHRLDVRGDHAPSQATIVVYDAATGDLLGDTNADREGKFRYRGVLDTPPYQVEVGMLVDGQLSLMPPVAVEDAEDKCDEEDEEHDEEDGEDEEEDEEEDDEEEDDD